MPRKLTPTRTGRMDCPTHAHNNRAVVVEKEAWKLQFAERAHAADISNEVTIVRSLGDGTRARQPSPRTGVWRYQSPNVLRQAFLRDLPLLRGWCILVTMNWSIERTFVMQPDLPVRGASCLRPRIQTTMTPTKQNTTLCSTLKRHSDGLLDVRISNVPPSWEGLHQSRPSGWRTTCPPMMQQVHEQIIAPHERATSP